MAYTTIADYVLAQIFGYQTFNALKNNIRYIGETVLNDPASNSHMISKLSFDDGATHGGRIYFFGGTTQYIEGKSDGTEISVNGIDFALGSGKLFKGHNFLLEFYRANPSSNDYLSNYGSANTLGFKAPRAGSILQLDLVEYCITKSSNGTARVKVFVAGSAVASLETDLTINAATTNFKGDTTVSRGTATFNANDIIDLQYVKVSGTFTLNISASLRGIMDT